MRSEAAIYLRLILASIQAKMEYRATFVFLFFALFLFYAGQIGAVLVVMDKFSAINGWNLGDMAFLYGLLSFSQGASMLFFSPLNYFEGMIQQGHFDRYLIRPLSPLLQTLSSGFEISSLAHFLIGFIALYFGSTRGGVDWDATKLFFLLMVIAGAALIHGAVRLAVSAVAFWTIRNRSLVHTIVYSSKEFIVYPISIYRVWIQVFLTVVFPIAFINFYPSHYFLARETSDMLFHPALQYLTPVIGAVAFWLSHMLWKVGIDHYQSVGS
ncbi:MAG: ABC-2 family transporter protein [Nitrospinae bacterium]|nr:ABC-2 family transporter protein [Nitrospinota bacterium]